MRVPPVRPAVALFTLLVLTGCGAPAPSAAPRACDPGPGGRSTVGHAENFSLTYAEGYQVLTVDEPSPGAAPESYVLVSCGATPELPPELASAQRIPVPVDSLYSGSTTHLPLLVDLDRVDVLTGVATAGFVSSPEVQARLAAGAVAEYAPTEQIDTERVVAAVVLTERVDAGLLTARELVALGRHPHTGARGTLHAADHTAVDDALAAVRAAHLAGRRVGRLSDGERQRVLVARALAQDPELLLLDEPTAFLDAPSRVSVTGMLRRLARERGMVVVASTHDVELALRVADRAWLLDRAGRIRCGPPGRLVTDGDLGRAFDSDELRFEPAAGTFVMRA